MATLTKKEKCDILLKSMLGSDDLVALWWTGNNKGFNNRRPIDVDIDEVFDYLMGHAFGGW